MKKILTTLLVTGSAITLSACENGIGDDYEYTTPYNQARTATHAKNAPKPAPVAVEEPAPVEPEPIKETPVEKVFKHSQSK